jgi:DNA segregation ATPase FtsK/SpoIIIE, S-DNA-T family
MILRLTVHDPSTRREHDVEVTASPDSSVGSLLAASPVPVGGRFCFVGPARLDPRSTLAGSPVLPGCVITVGEPGPDPGVRPDGAAGLLLAVDGPDRGRYVWLDPGRHVAGRSPSVAVSLRDPDASRRHAELSVGADGTLTAADLGSTNGTWVGGVQAAGPTVLAGEQVLEIGDGRFRWFPVEPGAPPFVRSADARLDFDRAFAGAPAVTPAEIVVPQPAAPPRGLATTLVSGLVPVVLGVVMALVLRQPALLLFALLGPVTAFVSYALERRQARANDRAFAERRQAAQERIAAHVADEERLRRAHAPDKLTLTVMAAGVRRGLWPRNTDSPDGLVLRVGTADRPATVELRGEPWPDFDEPMLRDVPVTVDLRATGVLGVVGPPGPADELTRWLLLQLAILRSPADLRLVVVTATDDDRLAWTRWLPHVDTGPGGDGPCWIGNTAATRAARVTELSERVRARVAQRGTAATASFTDEIVVLLDGALALRHLPGMREVLRDGPSVGVYAICVDRQDMNECHGLCRLAGDGAVSLVRSRDDRATAARAEGASAGEADRVARALAPLRDRLTLAAGQAAVPLQVRLTDLIEQDVFRPGGVIARWHAHPGPQSRVPIGADGGGVVTVDLAQQGPHTMLGGATGAGKSVLLQTLVTSLLLANRPDELNLILVDFKGGSAFLPFENCPHVVALLRNIEDSPADVFDAAAAERVVSSVRAEVRRREIILARYGGEIDVYWRARRGSPGLPPLPRLVLFFDEYARVLDQVSADFVKELVGVAGKGRSLGMHLVLSTQSLQGKLSAELKNNISLRITLRQNEPGESTEVLGVPDAATIPGRLRGRGMIVCTSAETRTPQLFQSGYLGDPPAAAGAAPARVRIVDWPAVGLPRPDEPVDPGDAATDLTLTVAAIEAAAAELRVAAPFRPLLPPLPGELPLTALTGRTPATAIPYGRPGDPAAQSSATAIPYGLLDDPAAQAQPVAALDLAGTDRLLVAGGPQSGRTTFARTFIESLAGRFGPDQVHLYVIEHQPAGLTAYDGLPHCGAVVSGAEPDRIRRLVTWLDGEVRRRTGARFAGTGPPDPAIVLLIDGWEYFENRADPAWVETSLLTTMRGIIGAGLPVGVHVVVLGGQGLISGRLPESYSRRLLLRFPKDEIRRQHLPAGTILPAAVPGRAVDAATARPVQICSPSGAAGGPWPASARPPHPFPPMPASVAPSDLPPASPSWIPLGVGGPGVTPIGVDLFEAGPHLLLVSGPARSGRTNAAAVVAHGLRRAGVGVLAIAPPRSPLPSLLPADDGVRVLTGATLKDSALRDAAEDFDDGRYAVIVDDCEQITVATTQEGFTEMPTLLQEIAAPDALGRRALVLCGDATPILEGQRRSLQRVVNEIMTAGTRVLLTPTSVPVARTHGFRLEPDQYFPGPPGRGHLAPASDAGVIQIALHRR